MKLIKIIIEDDFTIKFYSILLSIILIFAIRIKTNFNEDNSI